MAINSFLGLYLTSVGCKRDWSSTLLQNNIQSLLGSGCEYILIHLISKKGEYSPPPPLIPISPQSPPPVIRLELLQHRQRVSEINHNQSRALINMFISQSAYAWISSKQQTTAKLENPQHNHCIPPENGSTSISLITLLRLDGTTLCLPYHQQSPKFD